jgi:hypothetical protein
MSSSCRRILAISANPSVSGMWTSDSTQSNGSALPSTLASAACAQSTTTTSQPSAPSTRAHTRRIAGSSSTTSTRPRCGLAMDTISSRQAPTGAIAG